MLHPASAPTPDIIAQLALSTFASLPRSFKPVIRSNGVPEWTILASIILSIPTPDGPALKVVSLGTGVKCLPTNKLPPCGDALHDSHAEVLAKRGLGRFLLEEAIALSEGGSGGSKVLEQVKRDGKPKFRVRDGVGVHLYVSALPCGNASTLYTAAHQPRSMADLKESHMTDTPPSSAPSAISRGRNGYSNTTSLRTKPGRPDSFPSISMSCSDKIASWNVLGLQGGLLAKWFEPVYLDSVIIGGIGEAPTGEDVVGFARAAGAGAEGKSWEDAIRLEVEEALYSRLDSLESHLPHPYRLARPAIHFTALPFPFDKPTISALHPTAEPSPHPTSIVQYLSPDSAATITPSSSEYISEHLFNGVDRRASWKAPGLTPIEEKRRSGVCKLEMMRAGVRLDTILQGEDGSDVPAGEAERTYHAMKQGTAYQDVKTLLRGRLGAPGLVKGFEKCGELSITETPEELIKAEKDGLAKPPFVGWLVSGEKWELFDDEGNLSVKR